MSRLNRLERSDKDRVLAGVLGGLGKYLNVDPNILRIITVFLFVLAPLPILTLYLAAVFFLPKPGEPPLISSLKVSQHIPLLIGFLAFLAGLCLIAPFTFTVTFLFLNPLRVITIFQIIAAIALLMAGLILMTIYLSRL